MRGERKDTTRAICEQHPFKASPLQLITRGVDTLSHVMGGVGEIKVPFIGEELVFFSRENEQETEEEDNQAIELSVDVGGFVVGLPEGSEALRDREVGLDETLFDIRVILEGVLRCVLSVADGEAPLSLVGVWFMVLVPLRGLVSFFPLWGVSSFLFSFPHRPRPLLSFFFLV